MTLRHILGILLVLALAAPGLGAEPESPPPPQVRTYTLSQSVETGLRQNPTIKVADEAVATAAAQYGQQQSQKNPTFVFKDDTSLQERKAINLGRFGSIPVLDSVSSQIQLSLGVLLTTFGNVENEIAASFLQIGVESENALTTRQNLIYDIKQAFFGRLQADSEVEVAKLNLEVTRQSLSDTEKLFKQGVMARYDVVQAELQVTEATEQVARAENSVQSTTASFLTVLNEKGRGPVVLTPPDPITVDEAATEEQLEEVAFANRPEIRSLERSLEVAHALVEAARNSSNPTVNLSANYLTDPGNSFAPQDRYTLNLTVGWALWDGGLGGYQVEEAEAQVRSLESSGEDLRNQVRLQVEQAWLAFQLSEFTLETARKRVETAEVYADMARQRFLNGLGTSLEVQQSLQSLNDARQNQVVAVYNRDLALAQIELAIGRDFPGRRLTVTPEMLQGPVPNP